MGPPGAGKGSLATRCVHELGFDQLSTGNLCRKHISEGTQIGKQIDFAIKSGKLVSDELITDMVGEWLDQKVVGTQTVILDGFPRTVAQASGLLNILQERFGDNRLRVIKLEIKNEQVIERIVGRALCSNKECQAVYSLHSGSPLGPQKEMICDLCESSLIKRSDDTIEVIQERLAVYYHHEKDLLDFFAEQGQEIIELEVERPLEDIFGDFKNRFVKEAK